MAGFLDRIRNAFRKEEEQKMSPEAIILRGTVNQALKKYDQEIIADNPEKMFIRAAREAFSRNEVDKALEIIGVGRGILETLDPHERSFCARLDNLAFEISQKELVPESKLDLMRDNFNREIGEQIIPKEIDVRHFFKTEPTIDMTMRSMEITRDDRLKECKERGDDDGKHAIIRVSAEAAQKDTVKEVIRKLQEISERDNPDESIAAAMLLADLTRRVDIDQEIDEIYKESFIDHMPLTDKAFEALKQQTAEPSKENVPTRDTYDEIDLQLA